MKKSTNLREYLNMFKKRGWIVALSIIIALAISAVVNFFLVKPIYQAELTFMVNFNPDKNARVTKDDMQYATDLVEKYKPMIQSRRVTEKIKENLNLKISLSEIGNSIQITSMNGPIMKVTVQNTNPETAKNIANEVPKVFGSELEKLAKVDGIEIIDDAIKPTSPINSNKIKNMIISVMIATVIGICIINLLEYLD